MEIVMSQMKIMFQRVGQEVGRVRWGGGGIQKEGVGKIQKRGWVKFRQRG